MGTINPRARGEASVGGAIRARRLDTEQHRRLLNSIPKPKVAESTAGPVGLVRARAASVVKGAGLAYVSSWTFDSPTDTPLGGTQPGMVPVSDASFFNPVESGWYTVKAYYYLALTIVPTEMTVTFSGQASTSSGDTTVNQVNVPPRQFHSNYVFSTPFWVWGDGLDPTLPDAGIFGFKIEWNGSSVASTLSDVQLDIVRIA